MLHVKSLFLNPLKLLLTFNLPFQQQSLQLSQGQTGVPLPTFAHPEMQQGIPQQGKYDKII